MIQWLKIFIQISLLLNPCSFLLKINMSITDQDHSYKFKKFFLFLFGTKGSVLIFSCLILVDEGTETTGSLRFVPLSGSFFMVSLLTFSSLL